MNQIVTKGIVLARTNYGEADRILTLLTPDHGKLRLMAKGVRKSKSKLAGGIELFSVSDITFIRGRGEVGTLVSSRLERHYGRIVKDIDRTMLAYELIKRLNKTTEDECEAVYFELLDGVLMALDDRSISGELTSAWFTAQLLKYGGHAPNLETDTRGEKLRESEAYAFSLDGMSFTEGSSGSFNARHIKLLRLLFGTSPIKALNHVEGLEQLLKSIVPLIKAMQTTHMRV